MTDIKSEGLDNQGFLQKSYGNTMRDMGYRHKQVIRNKIKVMKRSCRIDSEQNLCLMKLKFSSKLCVVTSVRETNIYMSQNSNRKIEKQFRKLGRVVQKYGFSLGDETKLGVMHNFGENSNASTR